MANRLSKEKANLIASEYYTNGFEKVKALLGIGYTRHYATHGGLKLFDNPLVTTAIAKLEARGSLSLDVTMAECQANSRYIVEQGKSDNKLEAIARGNEQLFRSIGGFTDNVNNAQSLQINVKARSLPTDERKCLEASAEPINEDTSLEQAIEACTEEAGT